MGWLRKNWFICLIVLLSASSSTYGLYTASQHGRWAVAHSQLMSQAQLAMQGKPVEADPQAVSDLPDRLAQLYPPVIDLARKRYEARAKCTKLSTEGIDVICRLGSELLTGKRDSTSTYNAAKTKCETFEDANREFIDAHLNLSNLQGEVYAAWNEVWPGHNLNLSLKGSGLYPDVDANRLAAIQQKLMQRQEAIYAPHRKNKGFELPEDDRQTSRCINELFDLNNAVFAQVGAADHGSPYIFRVSKDNWIERVLGSKQSSSQQRNMGPVTSHP